METDQVVCTVIEEREKSFLLRNEEGKQVFFGKSQISFVRRNKITGAAIAEIPIWILDKENF